MTKRIWCGALLCCVATLAAKSQQQMGPQQMAMGSNQTISAAMLVPITDAQYQADKVSRSVQTLSDGTTITRETRGLIARDAQGRMREDLYVVQSGSMNGKQQNLSLQSATVADPVARTILIWSGNKSKVAMQMQMPSLPALPKMGVMGMMVAPPPPVPRSGVNIIKEDAPPPGQANIAMPSINGLAGSSIPDDVRTEDLGTQSIEGVLVTGKRVTTTLATGKVGNDRPIVVVHEEWRSPALKIVVKTVDTDPRTGEQTMELQGLSRADPDPSLFQPPAGYEVKDMAQLMKSIGNLGKTHP
jgi:hypothetical protein